MKLTKKEQQVVDELKKGKSAPEIAEALGIGYGTVRTHLRALHTKYGASNRTQLIVKLLSEDQE